MLNSYSLFLRSPIFFFFLLVLEFGYGVTYIEKFRVCLLSTSSHCISDYYPKKSWSFFVHGSGFWVSPLWTINFRSFTFSVPQEATIRIDDILKFALLTSFRWLIIYFFSMLQEALSVVVKLLINFGEKEFHHHFCSCLVIVHYSAVLFRRLSTSVFSSVFPK